METLKGEYKGECNRTACNNSNAIFYNHSTLKHYCGQCAYEINEWAQDFEKENGHKLCVKVEPKYLETLYRKVADLDLSIRTKNLLRNAGIDTLQELTAYTKSDLMKFRKFGRSSLEELENLMLKNSLSFGMAEMETIRTDNTQTLANALQQIEKLEAEKAEMIAELEYLQEKLSGLNNVDFDDYEKLKSLIQKMKQ